MMNGAGNALTARGAIKARFIRGFCAMFMLQFPRRCRLKTDANVTAAIAVRIKRHSTLVEISYVCLALMGTSCKKVVKLNYFFN